MGILIDLKIGVVGKSLGVISVLQQEGIPFFEINFLRFEMDNKYSTLLFVKKVEGRDIGLLKKYLSEGGTVIFDKLNKHLRYRLYAEKINLDNMKHAGYIECYKKENSYFIYIDKDLRREIEDRQAVVKEFLTEVGTVKEKVALFPKYKNREILLQALMLAFHIRNLPFIRLWYYPAACRSVFNFRFDLDEDTDNDLERIEKASKQFKDCTSWFVSCASFERNRFKIQKLIEDGFDVQSHGYYHHTYLDAEQNDLNIKKSIDYFHNLHDSAKGFVAPKGRWNEGLQMKLEKYGFLYSSEFSLDYDNLPFYPIIQNRFSTVLQIPVHPICWGSYKDASIENDEGVKKYLEKVIVAKYNSRQPALIYGHPSENIGKNPKLLEMIYCVIGSLKGLRRIRLTDFARWWSKRHAVRFQGVTFDASKRVLSYTLENSIDFSDLCLNINMPSDRSSYYDIIGQNGEVLVDDIEYEACNHVYAEPDIYRERIWQRSCLKRIKDGLVNMLDWEECTNPDDLIKDTIRGRVKYCLRKLGFDKIKVNI